MATNTLSRKSETSLEQLINNLDERGILVLQVLVGQRCMELLSKKHIATVTKPSVLKPQGSDL